MSFSIEYPQILVGDHCHGPDHLGGVSHPIDRVAGIDALPRKGQKDIFADLGNPALPAAAAISLRSFLDRFVDSNAITMPGCAISAISSAALTTRTYPGRASCPAASARRYSRHPQIAARRNPTSLPICPPPARRPRPRSCHRECMTGPR